MSGKERTNAGIAGKLQFFDATWSEPIRVTYTGGYDLPEDAPPALKQALALIVNSARIWATEFVDFRRSLDFAS